MQSNSTAESPKKVSRFFSFIKKNPVLITIIAAVIIIIVILFSKNIQAKKEKRRIEQLATQQLIGTNKQMLTLLAKPMVWTIRSEMLRGNLEQVNLLIKEMVKEKNFQFIHLVDKEGKVLLSTDKKLEGKSATAMFESRLFQTDSVMIVNTDDRVLTMATPVMGFDKQLGVVILSYKVSKFDGNKNN